MVNNKLIKINQISTKLIGKVEKYCGDPAKVVAFFVLFLTLFYTVQCSIFQNILGLDVLETITWGAQGTWGHAKHPPLSGWLGYSLSWAGNHKDWIMYLGAHVCIALSVIYVYKCARLFMDKYESGTAALLLYFLFYYSPSESKFCTYPLEMMLVPLASYYFFRVLLFNKITDCLALGVTAAAGLMNKYSFGLVILAWIVIFFRERKNFALLKSYKPYCAFLLMLLLIAPHLQWLYNNDFICFKHVGNRLSDEYKWYTPLVTMATAAYPYGMMALVIFLCGIADFRQRQRAEIKISIGINALLIALIPAFTLIVLSFFGDIIMMWFCTMASMVGIALVALCPWKIDQKFFAKIVTLLGIFSLIMILGTTIDATTKSKPRVHSNPQSYTAAATAFYRQYEPHKNIPIVVGTRFEATVLENYLPHRPPACEALDPIQLKLYADKIRKEGALLIAPPARHDASKPRDLEIFMQQMQTGPIQFQKITYPYRAIWGKKKLRVFYLGYLPPQTSSGQELSEK